MAKFQNRSNGRIVELLEVNDKTKVVLVQYLDDGKTTNFSPSTWKRYWREIKEDGEADVIADIQKAIEESDEEAVEVQALEVEQEVAGDGTPYSQVLDEIIQDEQQMAEEKKTDKAKRVTSKKRIPNENVPDILKYINDYAFDMSIDSYIRDKQPNLINYKRETGKVLFMIRKTYNRVEFFVKSKALDEKLAKSLEAVNGFYDRKLVITELSDDSQHLINSIIDSYKED